ncbi:MAG TPA: sugar MFS transporter [Steroidobacteraceae bacterium]|jgi:FHS family L-fucose permease-like MFS transporter|nr:sugar MFS transporter [Steroidobacteraceae bacterium]HXP28063.1 sugar MFS transporter [Steroidobacteraceae bacterium]
MHAGSSHSAGSNNSGAPVQATYAPGLQAFVFVLFFAFGGITSLNDVLIPKLRGLFTLSYGEVMLIQFAFFAAYFIISIPAAALVRRIGYMRSAVTGLLIMTAGCVLFIPASAQGLFGLFLLALFVLAAGITTVQVVANPLISMLGKPATVSSRLTFAQAFNSLGTTIFPTVGSILILGSLAKVDPKTLSGAALDAFRTTETQVIVHTYLGLAIALAVIAAAVWWYRKALVEPPASHTPILRAFNLLTRPRFAFGTLCIFLYVGGEVAIGSLIVNYLMQPNTLGLGAEDAGKHIQFYWGGAMVGRFIGSYVLRLFSPGKVLACVAAAVIALLTISANTSGAVSAWSLLAIGLFNSIMFPTIFTLANEGLGERAAEGSGVICMAIVGGAIVPLLTGNAADYWGLKYALVVPAACYCGILLFGWFARRPLQARA